MKAIDLEIGSRFGKLTVIRFIGKTNGRNSHECKCDCGKTSIVRTSHLLIGSVKTCGCSWSENMKRVRARYPEPLNKGKKAPIKSTKEVTLAKVYAMYRSNAKAKRRVFSLSKSAVESLIFSDCFYCGCSPEENEKNKLGKGANKARQCAYNGIDRKDNNLGYTANNTVTCCSVCNRAKLSLNFDTFLNWIKGIKSRP